MTADGATTGYTYNDLDQLLAAGGTTFAYDARGNLSRSASGADVTTYAWDARDRLSGVALPDGSTVAYSYDADGRRVGQNVDGAGTNYLWDEASLYGDVVLETDVAGIPLESYILGGTELLLQTRAGTTSYYLTDAQGSTRALTNGAAAVTDTYEYTAFGELFAGTGSTPNACLFTGQQFDPLARLYSLRARYYDPGLGRFLSRDPMEVQPFYPVEINRYGYAAGNPVNLADPTGLVALFEKSQLETKSVEEAEAIEFGLVPFYWRIYYFLRAFAPLLPCAIFCGFPWPRPGLLREEEGGLSLLEPSRDLRMSSLSSTTPTITTAPSQK